MADTRTVRIQGEDRILFISPTVSRPVTFDGTALIHQAGQRIVLTPEAAQRITDGIAAHRPATYETKTGLEVSQLPEAERAGFEYSHVVDGAIGKYTRTTPGSGHIDIEITPADVTSISE